MNTKSFSVSATVFLVMLVVGILYSLPTMVHIAHADASGSGAGGSEGGTGAEGSAGTYTQGVWEYRPVLATCDTTDANMTITLVNHPSEDVHAYYPNSNGIGITYWYVGTNDVFPGLITNQEWDFEYWTALVHYYYVPSANGITCTMPPPPPTPSGCGAGTLNDMCVVLPPTTPTDLWSSCNAAGTVATLNWSAPGSTHSVLGVDSWSNPWVGVSCATQQNPNDVCSDFAFSPYNVPVVPGVNSGWWVYACNASGCSPGAVANVTCPAPPPTTGSVQGYKVDENGTALPASFGAGVWTDSGQSSYGTNPYFVINVPAGGHWISTTDVSQYGYMIAHYDPSNSGAGWVYGTSAYVTVPANGAKDLWWMYAHGTVYCTGSGNASSANDWKYWQWKDFASGRAYQYYAPGDANCVAPTAPPAPTSINKTCSADGTSVVISWPAVSSATNYHPRIWIPYGSCATNWSQVADPGHPGASTCYTDSWFPATSFTFPITPGATYNAWVHSGEPVNWNAYAQTGAFSCAAPTPPANPANITASCPAPGTQATFSWPAVSGADIYQIQYHSSTGSCVPGWTLWPTDGTTCYKDISGTSASIAVTPPMNSSAWVDAGNTTTGLWANWSTQPSQNFTCATTATPSCTPGATCTASNVCGSNNGTYNSSCVCSATAPTIPANYGTSCPPVTNICGQTNGNGTIQCNGSCSSSAPPDSACATATPTINFTAPIRVRSGDTAVLTWSVTNATSCTLTNVTAQPNVLISSLLNSPAGGLQQANFTGQTTYTLTCANGAGASAPTLSQTRVVNLIPAVIER